MPLGTVNRGIASQQSLFNGILTPSATGCCVELA
jgi:hypothetical protein